MQRRAAPRPRRQKLQASAAAALLICAVAALSASAEATSLRGERESRYRSAYGAGEKPMLAIVSLANQRITVYGASGKLTEAPVSSGAQGYETPPGIFSIVQKKEDHRSNLYEDGEMPFMQRITWTGIALHAGALPGHPASHGCIRLPMAFAQELFGMTELGMRVVIVRDDMRPSDISHPFLFKSGPVPKELGLATQRSVRLATSAPQADITAGSERHLQLLQSIAAAKSAELDVAIDRQRETRAAAARAAAAAAAAGRQLRSVEASLASAEGTLAKAAQQLEKADTPRARERAESAKAKALAGVEALQARIQPVRSQEQAAREAAERANAEAQAALAAKDKAAQAAEDAARSALPVSVFISRKTQRLYVRRGTHPVFEGPVTIGNAQAPIGTFVFTAMDAAASGEMRWNVVSMYRNPTSIEPAGERPSRSKAQSVPAAATDVKAADAALDRITMNQEALDVIASNAVLPGSSLIISDEGPSRETGKDTDFIVVMSGEPQGALTIRQREPAPRPMDGFGGSPWGGGGSPFGWTW